MVENGAQWIHQSVPISTAIQTTMSQHVHRWTIELNGGKKKGI